MKTLKERHEAIIRELNFYHEAGFPTAVKQQLLREVRTLMKDQQARIAELEAESKSFCELFEDRNQKLYELTGDKMFLNLTPEMLEKLRGGNSYE